MEKLGWLKMLKIDDLEKCTQAKLFKIKLAITADFFKTLTAGRK